MGRPPKGKAIERLRKALDAISELEDLSNGSPEFEKWCRDTEVAIENTFLGESYAQVGFAVVLLTPDDMGDPSGQSPDFQPRARQNVILELGFFLGKLGRHRTCALRKQDVEIPSDYDGVLYISMDDQRAWEMKLLRELKEAGFDVNANVLL